MPTELAALITFAGTAIYAVLGLGVARATAMAHKKELDAVHFLLWPFVLLAFALAGDSN